MLNNKVAEFINRHQLLSRDGLHIVALSGGADSVALLYILRQLGYRIEAAHCNFHLRGEESDRDEAFAVNLCKELNIEIHLIHFDTAEYASLHKVSIEMAARELRYRYFAQLCQDIGAECVCVAHHRDDAVETFLMNLLRGTGIHGLTGIRPKNGNVVRPLLGVSRKEIEDYLRAIGQTYVTDSTNLVDDVVRNKIRIHVIPQLREINPAAVENIDRTANNLQEVEKIFNNEYACQFRELVNADSGGNGESISIPKLLQLPSPESFLYEWLSQYGFNASQVHQLFAHLNGNSGTLFTTPTHTVCIDRNLLLVEPAKAPMKPLKVPETGLYRLDDNRCLRVDVSNEINISKSIDCATLDASKIRFPLIVREVTQGDTFCPFGMEGHKLVSDFLTDQKLSLLAKRRQLVLTDREGTIVWLIGLRTDNRFRVTNQTSSILRITLVNTL